MRSRVKRCTLKALAGLFAIASGLAFGADYYVNDNSTVGDVYTSVIGSDAANGQTTGSPKLTITNLLSTYNLVAGDRLFIDTGIYSNYTVVLNKSGVAGNPIIYQGSTNYAAGGTILDRRSINNDVLYLAGGNHISVRDITARSGRQGVRMDSVVGCELYRVSSVSNASGFRGSLASSNRFIRCVASYNSAGFEGFDVANAWDQGVMWSNTAAFNLLPAADTVSVSNSVVVGGTVFSVVPIHADFNVFWDAALGVGLRDVSALQRVWTNSFQSVVVDPQFFNGPGMDFHPRSKSGRFDPLTSSFVADLIHSPLIDLGDPARVFTNETSPNGARMDLGSYGDSTEASRSLSNAWLFCISLNDGGSLLGTSTLYWAGGAFTSGATVGIQYSPNNGSTWSNLVSGLLATNRSYLWVATGAVGSVGARWRVMSESLPGVADTNDTPFALRPQGTNAFSLFVNDASTAGDVYCSGIGAITNDGLSADRPLLHPQDLLGRYALGGGDVVFLDTGTFTGTVTITSFDQGSPGRPVVFRGSTNTQFGGTLLDLRSLSLDGINIVGARYIEVRDLSVRAGQAAVSLTTSSDCQFERVHCASNSIGFRGTTSFSNRFIQCVAARNTFGVQGFTSPNAWDQGVVWSNAVAFSLNSADAMSVSNSVIGGGGTAFTISGGGDAPAQAEFNLYHNVSFGSLFTLSDIQAQKGHSFRSTWVDPLFGNPAGLDFRPRSVQGRWNPATSTYVTDTVHSAAIDFGDPLRGFALEPEPNGARLNADSFGNSVQASLSRTNPWFFAISYNDGGNLVGTGGLYWTWGGMPGSTLANLDYSPDGGMTWTNVVSGVAASNGVYAWVATGALSSVNARWRIIGQANTNVVDLNDTNFVVRAQDGVGVNIYVNDEFLAGDVYSTATGALHHTGLTPASPLPSIQEALNRFDLGPGDRIVVDTGLYTNPVTFSTQDQGTGAEFLRIVGSTNGMAGGTILDRRNASLDLVTMTGIRHVHLANLTLRGARYAVNLGSSASSNFFNQVLSVSNNIGFALDAGRGNRFENCAAARNTMGVGMIGGASARDNVWENGVAWSNTTAFDITAPALSVSNSVIGGGGAAFGTPPGRTVPSEGNFNAFWNVTLGGGFASLNELQEVTNGWWQSAFVDPQFAGPAGFDFHPRSLNGRWDPATASVVTDLVHSSLIDFGDPLRLAYTNEPAPNGSRVNAGQFGGTAQASRSRTNAWLLALTYNDGGLLSAPGDVIYWTYGQITNTATVTIEVSRDSGLSWDVVTSGLSIASGSYVWGNTNFASSTAARWRVVLDTNTNVLDATDANFTLRSGFFQYFLNDQSLVGDVYTTEEGDDENLGLSAASPKTSLGNLLSTYDLQAGDTIFVDTGTYRTNLATVWTSIDSGTNGVPVIIQGSTNSAAGGSLFTLIDTGGLNSDGLSLSPGVQDLLFRDIRITRRRQAFVLNGTQRISMENVHVYSNVIAGMQVVNSSNLVLRRVASYKNGGDGLGVGPTSNVSLVHCVVWANGSNAISTAGGQISVSNSVLGAEGIRSGIYNTPHVSAVRANYNNYYMSGNAIVGRIASVPREIDSVATWRNLTGQDAHSLNVDPLFADAGGGDFHLKTQTLLGRFDPDEGYVTDPVTSPLIDSADPLSPFSAEPGFNGSRANLGIYGNTPEASQGRSEAWLHAASLREGGWVEGTSVLHWVAVNFTNGAKVRVDFSPDGGNSWSVLTNGALAVSEQFLWNTLATNDTPGGRWRVVSVDDSNLFDLSTNFFSVRNAPLNIYVNDTNTAQDAYCSGPGGPSNWMASAAQPLSALSRVFQAYDLEPGDRIWVDSGTYAMSANLEIGRTDSGAGPTNPVSLIGNPACPGTLTTADRGSTASSAFGIRLSDTESIAISNLVLRGANQGLRADGVKRLTLGEVRLLNNSSNGLSLFGSSTVRVDRCVVSGNGAFGIHSTNSQVDVVNSIVWSNGRSAFLLIGGTIQVTNSVMTASGDDGYVFEQPVAGSIIRSDHNNFVRESVAAVSRLGATVRKSLATWQQATGNDLHSLTHDPGFADPASGDFFLKSEMGRYTAASCAVVTDAVGQTSAMIDVGNPPDNVGTEPNPNGNRVNLGIHGGTDRASRSRTNGWLIALSFNDGGTIRGTNSLYWAVGGGAAGHLVYIDFSPDNGVTWTNVATNLPAANGFLPIWDTTVHGSTPQGAWRVVSQTDTNILDRTDPQSPFVVNNGLVAFYVNDASTAGDVYATGPGLASNSGLTQGEPVNSIQTLLDLYDLGEGSLVLVDTGTYPLNQNVVLDANISGTVSNRFIIQGSTNDAAGGSVLNRGLGEAAFTLSGAENVEIRNFRMVNGRNGVIVDASTNCLIENISVEGVVQPGAQSYGVDIRNARFIDVNRCAVSAFAEAQLSAGVKADASTDILIRNGVFWSNFIAVEASGNSVINVSNVTISAFGNNRRAYNIARGSAIAGNYNNFHLTNGAMVAVGQQLVIPTEPAPVYFDTHSAWVAGAGHDRFSHAHAPGFANPAARDFHLSSVAGRVVPGSALVTDLYSSVLIDAGDPAALFTNEPAPNGRRVDLGRYGNSADASRTATNPVFTAVTFNDGGVASGTNVFLYWVAHGAATNHPPLLQYSSNGGLNWSNIVTNLTIGTSSFSWNTTNFLESHFAKWRVMSQLDNALRDETDGEFVLRNGPFSFYVNDTSTVNDVYTLGVGLSANSGLSNSAPKASIQEVLGTYNLEAGDAIFVDSGTYLMTSRVVVSQADAGAGSTPLRIVGSTNRVGLGTVLMGYGVTLDATMGMLLEHLTIKPSAADGAGGVVVAQASNTVIRWVNVLGGPADGFRVSAVSQALFDRCAANGVASNGIFAEKSEMLTWRNGLLWSNAVAVSIGSGSLRVSNTVVGLYGPNALGFVGSSLSDFKSDYNSIFRTNGAAIGRFGFPDRNFPTVYDSLSAWTLDLGNDRFSLSHDPAFASVGAADFHLRSEAGRFDPTTGNVVTDTVTSLMIDAGNPVWSVTNEPAPNGGRVNIGLYGDHAEASRSPTNARLTVVSLNDGGQASGTNVALYWVASGVATGHSITIEVSSDAGATWFLVTNNLSATAGLFYWNATNAPSTPLSLWRISSQADTNVLDQSDRPFAIRNQPITFYVNDTNLAGDVYCVAGGVSTNTGLSPSTPKATIAGVLQTYDLEPGDTILVDTGLYPTPETITIGQPDGGRSDLPDYVTIQGSTNGLAGGTVIDRQGGTNAILVTETEKIALRHLNIRQAAAAVRLSEVFNCEVEWVNTEGGNQAFLLDTGSRFINFRHCSARGASSAGLAVTEAQDVTWDHGVLWSNGAAAVDISVGSISVSNSVLTGFGPGNYVYRLRTSQSALLGADYNAVYLSNTARVANVFAPLPAPFAMEYENVSRWVRNTGYDLHSLSVDPMLADPGDGDFHLLSQSGRFNPATGGYTNDAVTSALIDTGDPFGDSSLEPGNGSVRLDIGLYGNSLEASLAPTNAQLIVVSLNDGGRAEGNSVPLQWAARGSATGHSVRVEFSSDAGGLWAPVQTGVPARVGSVFWNSTLYPSGVRSLWRVVSETSTSVLDSADALFAVRNLPLAFYVNDNSTLGDVYSTGAGSAFNTGLTPSSPMESVQRVIDRYDLEPGDVIYVDDGSYTLEETGISVGRFDTWDVSTNVEALASGAVGLTLQGATNGLRSAITELNIYRHTDGIRLEDALGVNLRDLRIEQVDPDAGAVGVRAIRSHYLQADWLVTWLGEDGIQLLDTENVTLTHYLGLQHQRAALYVDGSENVLLENGLLWSNQFGTVQDDGSLEVRNTAIAAFGEGNFAHLHVDGAKNFDYNAVYVTNNAGVGAAVVGGALGGGTNRLETVQKWNQLLGIDEHTRGGAIFLDSADFGGFHPLSPAGRFVDGFGFVTNALETASPLLDGGDPTSSLGAEPSPNGGRRNIGLFGGSAWASKSPSAGALSVITFNDGGNDQDTVTLNWNASGAALSHDIYIDFSSDGGATWTNIATNVSAALQTYEWDSVPYGRAAAGRWRVVSQVDSNVFDVSDSFFALRNGGSIPYYVNDGATNGDVYCTSPGSNSFNGYLPETPKANLQDLLNNVDLEEGDIVYVDTGVYSTNIAVVLRDLDAGHPTNSVIIQGSTNRAAGGTLFRRNDGQGEVLRLFQTVGMEVRNIDLTDGTVGLTPVEVSDCRFVGVRAFSQQRSGFQVQKSTNLLFRGCVGAFNGSNGVSVITSQILWDHGVLWDNTPDAVVVDDGGGAAFSNSVFRAVGGDSRIFREGLGSGGIISDYNNFERVQGARLGERAQPIGADDVYPKLLDWQQRRGLDRHSLSHTSQFANAESLDFHPQSATGRFQEDGTLTADPPGVFSPLIDTAAPGAAYTNEVPPNGQRANIGVYGNTWEASLSQTNPWVLAISLNDGGRLTGTGLLYWAAGALGSNDRVRLEFANNGVDFTLVQSNLVAASTGFVWDVSAYPNTTLAKWRVVSEAFTNIVDECDSLFAIINEPLVIYVNDNSLVGDCWSTGVGSTNNVGLDPEFPLADPADALRRYPLGPGDIVYIDAGTYTLSGPPMTVGLEENVFEEGAPGFPISLIGCTNGVHILGQGTNGQSFVISKTSFVDVENLSFQGGGVGVVLSSVGDVNLYGIDSHSHSNDGFSVGGAQNTRMDRCSSWSNGGWGISVGGSFVDINWQHGVLAQNRQGGVNHGGGTFNFSNSVVYSTISNSTLYAVEGSALLGSDFNMLYAATNVVLARSAQIVQPNLRAWQRSRNVDLSSVRQDPLFAGLAAGDFHVRSKAGRYDPVTKAFVTTDTNFSWAIDAGAPAKAFAAEPAPNGGRVNIGLHGDTFQASKSGTNPADRALLAVSFHDGGVASGTERLYWLTRGFSTSELVSIEVTTDGSSWSPIASNLVARPGDGTTPGVAWLTTNLLSTAEAYWRVVSQSTPSILDSNDVPFTIRNGPIFYYVNDTNLAGDVYTTAAGSPLNNGRTNSTPLHSVQAVIDRYPLAGGDVIFVDTGIYGLSESITFRADDSGQPPDQIAVVGSTNYAAGGSSFRKTGGTNEFAVFRMIRANAIGFRNLILEQMDIGFQFEEQSSGCTISNAVVRDGNGAGMSFSSGAGGNVVRHVLVTRMGGAGISCAGAPGNLFEHCVIWSNDGPALSVSGSGVTVSNSVLWAAGDSACYALDDSSALVSDYNLFYVLDGADYAIKGALNLQGLPQWVQLTDQDLHSLSTDPLFADAAMDDFHPQSPAGRFLSNDFVTVDAEFSYLIDTAGPSAPFAEEPDPNGGRANIGLYGGTAQASKSKTNEWLLAITASSGGRVRDYVYLVWTYGGGFVPTNNVSIDYSYDDGVNWLNVASNVQASQQQLLWDSLGALIPVTPIARWRVRSEVNPATFDVTDDNFGLNGPFLFYLNDSSLTDDIYTTGLGNDSNLGIFSNAPKLTLKSLLDTMDVDGEDTVLIDTGYYIIGSNDLVEIDVEDAGDTENPVVLLASTNGQGVTWDYAEPVSIDILTVLGSFVEVHNLRLRDGSIISGGTNTVLMNMVVTNGSVFLAGADSLVEDLELWEGTLEAFGREIEMRRVKVGNGSAELTGAELLLENGVFSGDVSPLITAAGTNIVIRNNTFVGSRTAFRQAGVGSFVTLRNNILIGDAAAGEAYCIQYDAGVLNSDYNLFQSRNGAWIGNANGKWEKLLYWQQNSGLDQNSLAADPRFGDEGAQEFHLKSVQGRYTGGGYTMDAVHSPAIDAGEGSPSFEPEPDGDRVNIGGYGNSQEASLSRTGAWVTAVTANDGGVLRGTNTLRWLSGNLPETNRFVVQYSGDAGITWTTVVNVAGNINQFDWNTTEYPSSLDAYWRVLVEADTGVVDATDSPFALRNDFRIFYVNDTTTVGDVYTTATGMPYPNHNGQSATQPLNSLIGILTNYDLEGGDQVLIDAGTYLLPQDNLFIWSDGGNQDAGLLIKGSTNPAAATIMNRNSLTAGSDGFDLKSSFVSLSDLEVRNAERGFFLDSNRYVSVERSMIRDSRYGVTLVSSLNSTVLNSRLWEISLAGVDALNSRTTRLEHLTVVNPHVHGVRLNNTVADSLQNNIFYLQTTNSAAYFGTTGSLDQAFIDYNIYYFATSAVAAAINGTYMALLPWQRQKGHDYRSSVTNPLFADLAGGDFHLQSAAGRYRPATGTWTNDALSSWAIDRGNPDSLFILEPQTNGGRVNIGAYGNTPFASKGTTNFVFATRAPDGDLAVSGLEDAYPLIWSILNLPTNLLTVTVQYSGDGGTEWIDLATGVAADQEYILWELGPEYNSLAGRWRIVGEGAGNTNIIDVSDGHLTVLFGDFEINNEFQLGGVQRITWRGIWDQDYQLQYAETRVGNTFMWTNIPASGTNLTPGGDATFVDLSSTGSIYRVYRVLWDQME